ncbi:MAG: DUF6768 family protein [Marinicella sp.]|nr:hypothetical protein [Xanthomonadales bacterium]
MNNIDQQIKQALNEEYHELIAENEAIEANPFKQMGAGFKGKMKWIYIQVMFFSVVFFAVAIYAIYQFYHEQEVKSLIGWGVTIIVFVVLSQLAKIWYWSELGRNRVIREVKLLELQVAHLIDRMNQK